MNGMRDVRFYVSIDWSKISKKEKVYSTAGGVLIAGSDGTILLLDYRSPQSSPHSPASTGSSKVTATS